MERIDEGILTRDEQTGDLNDLRLMSLLSELIQNHGLREAARLLEIDHRTIANCISQGTLTPRVRQGLERALHLGMGSAFQELTGRITALEGRVEAIDSRLQTLSEVVEQGQTETKASQESLLKMVRSTARKVDKLGAPGKKPARSSERMGNGDRAASAKSVSAKEPQQTTKWFPRRTYPQLVTEEPAEDDEYVYKEAWSVVHEWREMSKGHPVKGKTLTWMKRQERVLELGVRLLDEFQLTLPPERHPIDKEWRKKLLRWHDDDLRSVRGRIVRRLMLRWVRRILTLGLWRK